MTLGDLRKFTVRQQARVRFALSNGMECVVNEHGVAQVPALHAVPNFNLEQELAATRTFQLDSLTGDPKLPVKTRSIEREALSALTAGGPTAEVHDHDDE